MNNVTLTGRLTKNPEVRWTQGSKPTAIARYSLAVKRATQDTTDFINIVALGKSAEFAEKYFKKGMLVGIVGRIQTSTWEDKDKQKHYSVEVFATEQHFLEKRKDNTQANTQTEDDDVPF